MKSPKLASTICSTLLFLSVIDASLFNHEIVAPVVTPPKEQNQKRLVPPSLPNSPTTSSGVLWIRPTTTILDVDTNRYQTDYTRVLSISRGGGRLSEVGNNVTGSANAAIDDAKKALASASRKTTTAVTKAKTTAEQGWFKRVQPLEQELHDKKVKTTQRLEMQQKRWKEAKARLQSKVADIHQKLREVTHRK